jgi:competence protein ComEA
MSALAQKADAGSAQSAETANAAKININSATAEQLTSLPGIGPATAKLILEHRTKVGKFSRIEELMNIKGIGEKKFQSIKDLITL